MCISLVSSPAQGFREVENQIVSHLAVTSVGAAIKNVYDGS